MGELGFGERTMDARPPDLPTSAEVWEQTRGIALEWARWMAEKEMDSLGIMDVDPKGVSRADRIESFVESSVRDEEIFVRKVWDAYLKIAEYKSKECVILFDVDFTIASLGFGSSAETIRPTLVPLCKHFQSLPGGGPDIGLLSTRSRESQIQKMQQGGEFFPVRDYLDERFLISVGAIETHEDPVTVVKKCADILDPGKMKDGWMPRSDELRKLGELARLRESQPGMSVVMVDDLPYAGFLDGKDRMGGNIAGVYLGDGGMFGAW